MGYTIVIGTKVILFHGPLDCHILNFFFQVYIFDRFSVKTEVFDAKTKILRPMLRDDGSPAPRLIVDHQSTCVVPISSAEFINIYQDKTDKIIVETL